MKDPYLLHIFNPTKNVSPFDVNMAYEAAFDGVIPYANVTLEEVHALTQDTIFSRGPAGARRTGRGRRLRGRGCRHGTGFSSCARVLCVGVGHRGPHLCRAARLPGRMAHP